MTELTISAYDKFITESAEQYLQTVVLVDDRIYENESGSVSSHLTTPKTALRKAARKSATASSGKRGKEGTAKLESPEQPDEVSFRDVQNSFAKKRIICSLYQPNKSASFSKQSEVYKLCSTADVIVVDWNLHGDVGDKATTLVRTLVEQSRIEIPYQIRLVLIYTLEMNLRSVSNEIFDNLVEGLGEDSVVVEPECEGLVLTTDNARVVVLGKREQTTLPQFKDYCVPEGELAARTIKEFSQLASGLLQGIVLRGIANLRKNNRRVLARFHKDLDVAFLTHRSLLLPDEEAFVQVVPLLTDELRAVLDDSLGVSPLGKASDVKEILADWCDGHWKAKSDAALKIGAGVDALDFAKDVFCNWPTIEDYSEARGSKIAGLVDKKEDGSIQWKKNGHNKLSEYLLGDSKADLCAEKLGSLMSQRARYDQSARALHLGVIVREVVDEKRYLLCLQPNCDSVRLQGKSQPFMFCVLKEPADDKPFTHCIVGSGDEVLRLGYKPGVAGVVVSTFKTGTSTICAEKDDNGRFSFRNEGGAEYEWIAELKTEHAQRAAEEFGRQLSRVGLTESEWLRLNARKD